jgi:hypothetical protein
MEAMRAHLASANFDALIAENAGLLPSSVYGHYENFTQKLLSSKEVDNLNKPLNGRPSPYHLPIEMINKAISEPSYFQECWRRVGMGRKERWGRK